MLDLRTRPVSNSHESFFAARQTLTACTELSTASAQVKGCNLNEDCNLTGSLAKCARSLVFPDCVRLDLTELF